MFHRYGASTCLLLLAVTSGLARDRDSAVRSPAAAISPDAFLVVELPEPRAVLDRLFEPQMLQLITTRAEFLRRQDEQEFRDVANLIAHFEQRFATDLQGVLAGLFGGGLTLALGPGQQALLIVEAEDAAMLNEVHDFALLIARSEAEQAGEPDRVRSADYRGIRGWSFGPQQVHALIDNRLLVANDAAAIRGALDRLLDPQQPNLAGVDAYREARRQLPDSTVAWGFARADVLRELPLEGSLPAFQQNPLGTLLLQPLWPMWEQATWLTMALELRDTVLHVSLCGAGPWLETEGESDSAAGSGDGQAWASLPVPRQIGTLSLNRDLHAFYAAKDELFPQRTSGLIFFENMMGIFFGGRDLTEDVFAELHPEVRLIVAGQLLPPHAVRPQPELPGFALVLRMRHPQRFALVIEEAWQKALGLINFTRGQQAEPGLILDRPEHGDVRYTLASFTPLPVDDPSAGDTRFNFQPTLAMPGEYLIFSSTEALARDLIEAVQAEATAGPASLPGVHSQLEVTGPALAALLQANRETLIHQNMVEQGHNRLEAETEIERMLAVFTRIVQLKMTARTSGNWPLTLEIGLDLQP